MHKSLLMAGGIIVVGFMVALVALNYTNNAGQSSDMRARAGTETIIDSDAMLDAAAQSVEELERDPVLQEDTEQVDDAELEEINAL